MDPNFTHSAVTQEAKIGFIPLFAILFGFTLFSSSMLTGGALALGLSTKDFLLASFLGALFLGIYASFLGYIGSKTGLSSHLLSHYTFGTKGSYLVSFLIATTQIGWFGVGLVMLSLPIHHFTGIHLEFLVLFFGITMTVSAYFGMKSLAIMSFIAIPSIILLGSYSINQAIIDIGGISHVLDIKNKTSMGLLAGIGMAIGSFISGGTIVADYTRFYKSPKKAILLVMFAFLVGNMLMFMFGSIGAKVYNTPDISEVLLKQGLIISGILVLGLNIWTTNDNALYSAGLGYANIFGLNHKKIVLICGLIGTILALPINNNFISWLKFLSLLIPPIGGVLITDYFIIKRYFDPYLNKKTMRYPALFSWLVGVIASIFLPGLVPVNGILVSSVFLILCHYTLFRKEIYKNKELVNAN